MFLLTTKDTISPHTSSLSSLAKLQIELNCLPLDANKFKISFFVINTFFSTLLNIFSKWPSAMNLGAFISFLSLSGTLELSPEYQLSCLARPSLSLRAKSSLLNFLSSQISGSFMYFG